MPREILHFSEPHWRRLSPKVTECRRWRQEAEFGVANVRRRRAGVSEARRRSRRSRSARRAESHGTRPASTLRNRLNASPAGALAPGVPQQARKDYARPRSSQPAGTGSWGCFRPASDPAPRVNRWKSLPQISSLRAPLLRRVEGAIAAVKAKRHKARRLKFTARPAFDFGRGPCLGPRQPAETAHRSAGT